MRDALSVKPDVILLDLMMPQPDGFKLCEILRVGPHFLSTPIIIVTASGSDDDLGFALGVGANDYITKSFHTSDLVRRIENILREKRLGLYD